MKGHIRKRGDSWELRVYVGTDTVTGKERTVTRTFRGGKREAQRALAEFVADAQRGRLVRTSATVGELLEAWFEQASRDFAPTTIVETRGFIDRNLVPALGHIQLNRLKPADLDRYYTRLTKSGSKRVVACHRPQFVASTESSDGHSNRRSAGGGSASTRPHPALPPRVATPELRPPSPQEVATILKIVVDDPEFAVFLQLSSVSGARRSELLALALDRRRPGPRDDDDSPCHRRRAGRRCGEGYEDALRPPSRVGARTVEVLRQYRQYLHDRAASCGVTLAQDCLVFASDVPMSRPCYPGLGVTALQVRLPEGRRRGCAPPRPPPLRRHAWPLSAGVDVRTVAGRLGHRNTAAHAAERLLALRAPARPPGGRDHERAARRRRGVGGSMGPCADHRALHARHR